MTSNISLMNILATLLYLFSSLGYLLRIIFSEKRMGRIALILLTLGAVVHTSLLVIHVAHNPAPYILSESDFYEFVSWVIAVGFLLVRLKYSIVGSGSLLSPLILLFFVLSLFTRGEYRFGTHAATNPWAVVHLLFMSFAFAVFAVSFLVGCVYLIQESQLKNRQSVSFLTWLPSLETMDLVHYRALTVGFVLLSIGIFSGAFLSKSTKGYFFTGDPRQSASLVVWAVYALFLNVRLRSGWKGRKGILLSVLGFLGVILTFLALEHRM